MSKKPESNNRIICVDDETNIVQAYVDFLAPAPVGTTKRSSRGQPTASAAVDSATDEYVILRAHSGQEALTLMKGELAAGRHVAAGFFDVKMGGGLDGIQTIQEIWKLDPGMHCTIVTAYQDRSVQDIGNIFGPRFKDQWDYLSKPFTQGEIVQKARQMVAAWNRLKTLEEAIAQLTATQKQLVQSERFAAIGQVARGVGHEFGNILQRIVGKSDLALHESDIAKVHAHVNVLIAAAESAAVIVRNLQAFSRTASARSKIELSKVIKDTLALVSHEFVTHSVTCVDQTSVCASVTANAGELQQVFMNLLINSLHATPKGGKIEIGCRDDGDSVLTWISDSGCGIPADVLPLIFDYAFTTKGDKGSGLGLSISRQLIESNGGKISVQSAVGTGTKFEIRLPVTK
ncbi:MAG: hypothetical protein HY074_01620 [Deltaproteobacteria bacterium]|nr:hypothetical protein [Deltaproteobacteria bacterium]